MVTEALLSRTFLELLSRTVPGMDSMRGFRGVNKMLPLAVSVENRPPPSFISWEKQTIVLELIKLTDEKRKRCLSESDQKRYNIKIVNEDEESFEAKTLFVMEAQNK